MKYGRLIGMVADRMATAPVRLPWVCPLPTCDGRPHDEWAHPHARTEQRLPQGRGLTVYFRGGRGSGKTRSGTEGFADTILGTEPGEWGVVAPTFGDARDTCIEGLESGLIRALGGRASGGALVDPGPHIKQWNRSMGQLYLRSGSVVYADGADDGALRVQGKNLRGVLADEIGLWKQWKTAWDESIKYAVRLAPAIKIVVGTPKNNRGGIVLVKRLLNDPDVVNRRLRTVDNAANLDDVFLENVMKTAGTQLGLQELEGDIIEEAEGALWTRDETKARVKNLGLIVRRTGVLDDRAGVLILDDGSRVELGRRGVALDPADGAEEGDEQGIAAGALGADGKVYLLHSSGWSLSPKAWLAKAHAVYETIRGDGLVVERNYGGAFLTELVRQELPDANLQLVDATQGKRTRAEPVAARYAGGQVVHVDLKGGLAGSDFGELEAQQCSFTGAPGEKSPDRLDAMVWLVAWLTGLSQRPARRSSYDDRRLAGRR